MKEMKFALGGLARLKNQGNLVEVVERKCHEKIDKDGNVKAENNYLVRLEKGTTQWFQERTLVPAFDNEFNLGLNQLLIDVNLKSENFHYVQLLNKEQDRLKG